MNNYESPLERIENQVVDLIANFKVPGRARVGSEAKKYLDTMADDHHTVLGDTEEKGTVLTVHTFGGAVEIVEDATLPPDAVVVEEQA